MLPLKREIIKDKVSKESFEGVSASGLRYAASCEDCTHFDAFTEACTFGFPTQPHLRRNQLKSLEETGTVAFCRTMEID